MVDTGIYLYSSYSNYNFSYNNSIEFWIQVYTILCKKTYKIILFIMEKCYKKNIK